MHNPALINRKNLKKALSVLYHTPATFIAGLKLRQLEG